jgi:hypothetical protein
MELIFYSVIVIIAFITGSLLSARAYKQGLTHAWNLKQGEAPKEFKNPIVKIVEDKKLKEEAEQAKDLVNEYLHDPRDDV